MKNVKKIIAAAALVVFAISSVGCNMISKTPEAIAKSPVAKVNNDTITRGQLDERMAGVIKQLKAQYGENFDKDQNGKDAITEQRKQMIDNMITEKLLLQKAKELKLVPSDADLKKESDTKFDEIKKSYKDDTKFNTALKDAGFTEATLKENLKSQIIVSKLIDNLTKDVKVEDKEIEDYYNQNKANFTEKPNTIHLAHILVKTEDEANKAKARLDKGEAFDKIAKELSTDPGSKDKGGDLGEVQIANSGFDPKFMAAASILGEGAVSAPVQTQFGWHIIKCIKKTEYPTKKLGDVKEQIKQQLLGEKKNKLYTDTVAKWKKDAKIKMYDKNL